MNLIKIPRLIPKGAKNPNYNLPYENMEEMIQEYITRHMSSDLCYIFLPRTRDDTDDEFCLNKVEDIIGRVVSVQDENVLIDVINKEFFKSYEGKLYFKVACLAKIGEYSIHIDKIVRFEVDIKD